MLTEPFAFLVVLFLSATGLILLPWVGFMAVFVVVILALILVCHFWNRFYLTPVVWASDWLLSSPSVMRGLPMGSMRLATSMLVLLVVGLVVVPGLVAAVVLPLVGADNKVPFFVGALAGFGLSGMTAVLHPMCPIAGCGEE